MWNSIYESKIVMIKDTIDKLQNQVEKFIDGGHVLNTPCELKEISNQINKLEKVVDKFEKRIKENNKAKSVKDKINIINKNMTKDSKIKNYEKNKGKER